MSQLCTLTFTDAGGTQTVQNDIVRLVFRKDIYMAGTELSGTVIREGGVSGIVRVRLTAGGRMIHDGYLEYAKAEHRNGRTLMHFSSKGWSYLLTQNEPVPGLNYQVNLTALAALNTPIPNVTYESGTLTVNYVSVKEHSTIWDAVSAYAMKAYGTQPYIIGTNEVSVTERMGADLMLESEDIISEGTVCDRRSILSKGYMADYDGQYSVSLDNPEAAGTGIVREKYFAFDRQWLSSLTTGIQMRFDRTGRRSKMSFLTVRGYGGEEIFDNISFMLYGTALTRTIGGIELQFEKQRVTAVYYTME